MVPLHNRVHRLSKLVDQVIINLDKHEDQIDIVEQALFGRSRAMNQDRERERLRQQLLNESNNKKSASASPSKQTAPTVLIGEPEIKVKFEDERSGEAEAAFQVEKT